MIRSSIIVAPFEVPVGNKFWWRGGAEAIQEVLGTGLASGTGCTAYASQKTNRRQAWKTLYQITGRVTEYGKYAKRRRG